MRTPHLPGWLDSIGQKATGGWGVGMDAGHDLLGDNMAGDVVGGLMGGVLGGFGGLGQTLLNSGAAVTMGARSASKPRELRPTWRCSAGVRSGSTSRTS